jgi:hypothetical protein
LAETLDKLDEEFPSDSEEQRKKERLQNIENMIKSNIKQETVV